MWNRRTRQLQRQEMVSRKILPNRLLFAQVGAIILFGIIVFRLFELQIIHGKEYAEKANNQMSSLTEIPAERGEILANDGSKLATNTTLDLVYVDPKVTPDKRLVADMLAPLLFTDEDYEDCLEEPKFCPEGSVELVEFEFDEENENSIRKPPEVIFPTRKEAEKAYADEMYRQINREFIDFLTLKRGVDDEILDQIMKESLPGIDIVREKSIVYVDPTDVPQNENSFQNIASTLSPLIEIPEEDLKEKLKKKEIRYVPLKRKIRPEVSKKIIEMKKVSAETHRRSLRERGGSKETVTPDFYQGIVLTPERWRYYPENELAAQVIGYLNQDGVGQYGIEGKLDSILSGEKGVIESHNDVSGRGVDPKRIQNAQDGVSVVLTIDRVVQKKVEEILFEHAEEYNADSGQIIVMDPKSGKVLALANYPAFNPNEYGLASLLRRTTPQDMRHIYNTTPLFVKDEYGRIQKSDFEAFEEAWKQKFDPEFYIYRNGLGPGSYVNRTVQEVYEPGSVFKPISMAIAIQAGETEPSSMCNEDGPVELGDFLIKTATGEYHGWISMNDALGYSSNPCMVEEVAFPVQKAVMHDFIVDKFGFSDYTDIELDQEQPGMVRPKKNWSDAHLATSSFGQGFTATPMQVIQAWTALANGGIMMRPQIIEKKIWPDGAVEEIEPEMVRQVLSPNTATKMTSMLVYSVDNGVAWPGGIPGYSVAGKTGSSQIPDPKGNGYLTGEGAVITTFAGYAPAHDPEFLVLVKFDRPRHGNWETTWGSTTAAPVFGKVMNFLLENANVPADRL